MPHPLVYFLLQTIFCWGLIFILYRIKNRITLVPLYAAIAIFTLLTHNINDLGFSIAFGNWVFYIASVSFFTSMLLGVLFLYLFEGPRATRLAIWIALFTSFFYIALVFMLGIQADTANWVIISKEKLITYFWSIFAIIVDVFFIALFWELLAKIKVLPTVFRIFLVFFVTYALDSAIYVTGVYGGKEVYLSILQGGLMVRLFLALGATPIVSLLLQTQGYKEVDRTKPRDFWEILNFRSDLETKIKNMEELLSYQKKLEAALKDAQEKYTLAVEGANAGIWDWDIPKDHIMYSAKFASLLGYNEGELLTRIDDFKKIVHPEDIARTFSQLEICFSKRVPYSIEYRLKNKDGSYKWYQAGGITKFNENGDPVRMVGSIVDINDKKYLLESYEEKVKELEKFNRVLVDRELKMTELKEEIQQLKLRN